MSKRYRPAYGEWIADDERFKIDMCGSRGAVAIRNQLVLLLYDFTHPRHEHAAVGSAHEDNFIPSRLSASYLLDISPNVLCEVRVQHEELL